MVKLFSVFLVSTFLFFVIRSKQDNQDKGLCNDLLGSWTMCKTDYINKKNNTTSSIVRNVCPNIIFKRSNNGDIKMGDRVIGVFKWKVGNGHLIITTESNADSAIPSGQYNISYKSKEVTLSATKGIFEMVYFLYG